MSIIRTEKNANYTTICNKCLRDKLLSARAKGVFAYIMTLPDDWKLYKSELHTHFSEGRDAINTAFAELENAGYITKRVGRLENGSLDGWDYTIYESTELLKTRNTVNPSNGKPASTKYLSSLSNDLTNGESEKKENKSTPKTDVEKLRDKTSLELCRRLINGTSAKLGRKMIATPSSAPILKLYRAGITEKEVSSAIEWLVAHAGEQYTPVVHSGNSLVSKWDQIQVAMSKKKPQQQITGLGNM